MESVTRERLLEEALIQLDRKGREAMRREELLAAAGIDEEEFTDAYEDMDECIADAFERLTIRLDAAMRLGCGAGRSLADEPEVEWTARVRGGLEALLAELAERPEMARALTVAYPSLGPAQQARYQRFIESFGPLLRTTRETGGRFGGLPGEVEMLAVGSAEVIMVEEIRAGRAGELPRMGPEILFSVLVPFIGAAAATEAMERARSEEPGR